MHAQCWQRQKEWLRATAAQPCNTADQADGKVQLVTAHGPECRLQGGAAALTAAHV